MDAAESPFLLKALKVAPDRHVRDVEPFGKVGDGDPLLGIQEIEHLRLAVIDHGRPPPARAADANLTAVAGSR